MTSSDELLEAAALHASSTEKATEAIRALGRLSDETGICIAALASGLNRVQAAFPVVVQASISDLPLEDVLTVELRNTNRLNHILAALRDAALCGGGLSVGECWDLYLQLEQPPQLSGEGLFEPEAMQL